ncbi:MAG: hypothetical protein J7466_06160 [Roseiflexus sp.]|jgi:hypothetical protein|nr:hypothetical protein [Roseiflexus sp.]
MPHIYVIRQTLRSWLRDWGGALTIMALILVIPCAVWMALELGDAETRNWLAQTTYLFFSIVAMMLTFRVARAAHVPARIRRSWLFFGAAFLASGLGNAIWLIYTKALHQEPAAS